MEKKSRNFKNCLVLVSVFIAPLFVVTAAAMEPMPEHEHSMVQIPDGKIAPSLRLEIHRDNKSGFNLAILTKNFFLEPPEQSGGDNGELLEGHAHIFINGQKVYRAYSTYIHLPSELFTSGINQVMVSLNDHDHNTWSKGQRMVLSTVVIDTSKADFLKHSFNVFGD